MKKKVGDILGAILATVLAFLFILRIANYASQLAIAYVGGIFAALTGYGTLFVTLALSIAIGYFSYRLASKYT